MAGELILIVDDESSMIEILDYNLKKAGFRVISASNGVEALAALEDNQVDLVALDVMMPEMDGIETCRRIRRTSSAPVIMLTAKASEANKIEGLNIGADDYVTKPFSIGEFIARVNAVLRRSGAGRAETGADVLSIAGLKMDRERREFFVNSTRVELTTREFDLLYLLASKPGVVFTRERILDVVWGDDRFVVDRAIDVHVRHIRSKIEDAGGDAQRVSTVRGVGYRFDVRGGNK